MEDMMRVGRCQPSGLLVVVDEKREQQEVADEARFGPIEMRYEEDRAHLSKMMQEILHMSEFRGCICLGPSASVTKDKIKARRRLWRHFAD